MHQLLQPILLRMHQLLQPILLRMHQLLQPILLRTNQLLQLIPLRMHQLLLSLKKFPLFMFRIVILIIIAGVCMVLKLIYQIPEARAIFLFVKLLQRELIPLVLAFQVV